MKECLGSDKCPFRLLHNLLKALPSGKAAISWQGREIQFYSHVESESKVNMQDVEKGDKM